VFGAIVAVVIVVEHRQVVVMRVPFHNRFSARLALFKLIVQFVTDGGSRTGRFGSWLRSARRALLARFATGTAATPAATPLFGRRFTFRRRHGHVSLATVDFGQRFFDKVRFVIGIGRKVRLFVARQSFDFRARGALRHRARGTIALCARWTIAAFLTVPASAAAATPAAPTAFGRFSFRSPAFPALLGPAPFFTDEIVFAGRGLRDFGQVGDVG